MRLAKTISRLWSAVFLTGFVFVLSPAAVTVRAGNVEAPYENTFSEGTSASDIAFAAEGRWIHVPAEGVYSNNFKSATTTAGFTAVNLGGSAADAHPFTFTTDFKFLNGNGTKSYVGVGFLSQTESLQDSGGYIFRQVLATPHDTQVPLFLLRNGQTVASSNCFMQLRYSAGKSFRITVSGRYVDTDGDLVNDALDISAVIENPDTGERSELSYRDYEPLTGNAFGVKTCDVNNKESLLLWDFVGLYDDTPRLTFIKVK